MSYNPSVPDQHCLYPNEQHLSTRLYRTPITRTSSVYAPCMYALLLFRHSTKSTTAQADCTPAPGLNSWRIKSPGLTYPIRTPDRSSGLGTKFGFWHLPKSTSTHIAYRFVFFNITSVSKGNSWSLILSLLGK